METLAYLAPIAFIFGLAAISQVNLLKKDMAKLEAKVDNLQREILELNAAK